MRRAQHTARMLPGRGSVLLDESG